MLYYEDAWYVVSTVDKIDCFFLLCGFGIWIIQKARITHFILDRKEKDRVMNEWLIFSSFMVCMLLDRLGLRMFFQFITSDPI